MSMSRKLQYQLLAKNGVVGRLPFIAVEGIENHGCVVVFQGVEGAYSGGDESLFPGGYHLLPCGALAGCHGGHCGRIRRFCCPSD